MLHRFPENEKYGIIRSTSLNAALSHLSLPRERGRLEF